MLRALNFEGRYVVIGFASGDIPQIPLNQVLLNDRTVIGIDWGYWAGLRPEANAELLDELFAMVRDGRLRPAEPTAYRLDDAARALDDLEHRRIAGKVVLAPQDDDAQARRAFRSCLRTLPNELWGSESTSSSCSGHFCTARPRLRQWFARSARVGGGDVGRRHHERAHALAGARIGCGDDRDVDDRGVLVERFLDLQRRDVLGVADDDVLDPTGHAHVAVGVDDPEVAGAEPAVGVERGGVERGVDVPEEALRTAEPELALLAGRALPLVAGDHADAHARPPWDRPCGRAPRTARRVTRTSPPGTR